MMAFPTTAELARLPATLALVVACLVGYGVQIAGGAGWWDAAPADLLRLGANYAPAIAAGEAWRLLASAFLHGGLPHLLINLLALADLGGVVERRLGAGRTATVFLASAVLGSLASAAGNSGAVSVGASAGIFGLFAVWLMLSWSDRRHDTAPARRRRRALLAATAALALGGGFLIPGVDNAAHFGGCVAGLLFGATLGGRAATARRGFVAVAATLVVLVIAAVPRFPEEWAVPYREGRRFDALYREFARADRQLNGRLRQLGSESRAGRISDAAALARLDDEILPALRRLHQRWLDERFTDAGIEKERALWIEYSRLRLSAITALRAALSGGDGRLVARFEAEMAAAAALAASVRQRQEASRPAVSD